MAEKRPCEVPECDQGSIRMAVLVSRTYYGTSEQYARFAEYPCEECRGLGFI